MSFLNNIADKIKTNQKYHFWLFLVTLTALTCLMIICYQPSCLGHDTVFHLRRFNVLIENLSNPYFIYLDYSALDGYGYFQKAIYSDFILIPFAYIAKISDIGFAYQSMIFIMTILCGAFTYKMIDRIYKNPYAAFIGAILFTFCVYRLLDIYHRAALGEVFSFTFLPLVIWGLYEIIKGDYKKKWYIFSIGCWLQFLSHILSTVLLAITILILLVIYYKSIKEDVKRLYYLILAGIIALILSSYFLFPMIEQMLSNTFYYQDRQVLAIAQDTTLKPNWIIWGLFTGIVHPKHIFIPGIGVLLTVVVCARLFVEEKSAKLKSIDIGVIIGVFYIFASSSLFPWSYFPFNKLNFIQLPWRLFEFSSFFFAVAGGYYLSCSLKTNKRRFIGASLIIITTILIIVSDSKLYEEIRCGQPIDISNNYELGGQEFMPAKVPSLDYIKERKNIIKSEHTDTHISNYIKNEKDLSFNVNVVRSDKLELPLTYYKGYTAKLNNEKIEVKESNNGLIEIEVKGKGRVEVYYEVTIMQKIGFFITIISIFVLGGYIIIQHKKRN